MREDFFLLSLLGADLFESRHSMSDELRRKEKNLSEWASRSKKLEISLRLLSGARRKIFPIVPSDCHVASLLAMTSEFLLDSLALARRITEILHFS